jgi:DNA-binding transcriptional LysR family regulator
LSKFHEAYPKVRIRVVEVFTPSVADAVADGSVDLGIGNTGEPWMQDHLVLLGAPGATIHDPVVTFVRGAALRGLVDKYFPDAEVVMELGSIAAVKGQVRAGMGITLLSRSVCADELATGALVELDHPFTPIPRTLCLTHAGIDTLPPAARRLREMLLY